MKYVGMALILIGIFAFTPLSHKGKSNQSLTAKTALENCNLMAKVKYEGGNDLMDYQVQHQFLIPGDIIVSSSYLDAINHDDLRLCEEIYNNEINNLKE